jgi:hypothetical protein
MTELRDGPDFEHRAEDIFFQRTLSPSEEANRQHHHCRLLAHFSPLITPKDAAAMSAEESIVAARFAICLNLAPKIARTWLLIRAVVLTLSHNADLDKAAQPTKAFKRKAIR